MTATGMTPDVDALLRAGKLEQTCPDCGRWEAAHKFCSGCGRAMGPGDWYRNGDIERRAAARQIASETHQTPVKRGPGRPRRLSGQIGASR